MSLPGDRSHFSEHTGQGGPRDGRTAGAQLLDLAGRLRGRAGPGTRHAAGRRRAPAAQVDLPSGGPADRRRRGVRGPGHRGHRRHDHGPEHVRSGPRPLGGRGVDRLVGRGAALPPRRVRAHPPPAPAPGDGRRHHLPLRDRGHRGGAPAGPAPPPAAPPSGSGAGSPRSGSTCGPGWSTSCTWSSCRSCWAPASGCSTPSTARSTAGSASSSRRRGRWRTSGCGGPRRPPARERGVGGPGRFDTMGP